jgi:hypothetical protein
MRYLRGDDDDDDDDDDLVALVDTELSSRAGRSVNFSSGSGLESETATLASNGKQQEQTAAKKKAMDVLSDGCSVFLFNTEKIKQSPVS